MKKILPILLALALSLMVVALQSSFNLTSVNFTAIALEEAAVVSQPVLTVEATPHKINKMYYQQQLIGIVTDTSKINSLLAEVYKETYKVNFPNTNIGLGEDVYITSEESYSTYANKDAEIFDYLKKNDLFSVEATKIEFSNGAVIYVKNINDFEVAKEQYLLNFISQSSLELIKNKQLPAELSTYGDREIAINVLQTTTISKSLAPQSKILMDKNAIIYFLSYGYGVAKKTYTVQQYDTVEGVGSKNGLSAQQIITINNDILKSTTQILEVGSTLNVTYFDSPITVVVTRERLTKEVVYAATTQYVNDPTLREGTRVTQTREQDGYANVKYKDTWINGVLTGGEKISSMIIKQPIREVIRVGTLIVPRIGSGNFRWPVDNPSITCRFGCYSGHNGLDMQNRYNLYGNVYAADRGVVYQTGYDGLSGNYIIINHNNGLMTKYNHLSRPAFFGAGVVVEKGEIIGKIGMTGYATGPHVHFMIIVNGTPVNPCRYLGC